MLKTIQQVLRLITAFRKQREQRHVKTTGRLVVFLWTQTGAQGQTLCCSVAAAGSWCTGIKMEELLPDLRESLSPSVWPCPHPDLEGLCVFNDLHCSPPLLLSFQMKDARLFTAECFSHIEDFLHTFSLANAMIETHLKVKFCQQTIQREFRAKIKKKVPWANQLWLDVTCSIKPPDCVKKRCWCQGGHPVHGGRLPLSIPAEAMDQCLLGELSVQPVTLLQPCVKQYPNLAAQVTEIQLLLFSPSNAPVTGPSCFFQKVPIDLDFHELGLQGIHCSSFKDVQSGGAVYVVEHESCKDAEQDLRVPPVQQTLLLLLFLQHSDPFTSHLSDMMAADVLIERHLEDILNNNRLAVIKTVQTEIKNILEAQNVRRKDQEKLQSAAEVILSSSISIVSCSSNVEFRIACLKSMKVGDTLALSSSLCGALRRVTSCKFTPRNNCYSCLQIEEDPDNSEPTRTEI